MHLLPSPIHWTICLRGNPDFCRLPDLDWFKISHHRRTVIGLSSLTESVVPRTPFLVSWSSMSSFQQSAAALIDERLNLIALLRELNQLREQVRKAELALRSRRVDRRKRTRIRRLEPRSRAIAN
jgi:hypothetical protein